MELTKNILIITFYVLAVIFILTLNFAGRKMKKKIEEAEEEYYQLLEESIKVTLKEMETTKKLIEAKEKELKKIGEEKNE